MGIRFAPSQREIRRAETRMVLRFFAVIAVVTLLFIAVVGVHYLLGWW
jgi:hypothetical protein